MKVLRILQGVRLAPGNNEMEIAQASPGRVVEEVVLPAMMEVENSHMT
jgi:hypothetical protein